MRSIQNLTIANKKNWNEMLFISLLFFITFFICVLRPLQSMDTMGYYNYFLQANLKNPHPEKTFVYLSLFWRKLFGDVVGFRGVIFTYTLIAYGILIEILKKCKHPFLSFIIYFSFAYMYQLCIQMRSSVSNLIFLLALFDIRDRKLLQYYFKMFIAFLIHNSAVFFVIVYPIAIYVLKHKKMLKWLPLFAIIGSFVAASSIALIVNKTEGLNIYIFRTLWTYYSASKIGQSGIHPINSISLSIFCFYYYFVYKVKIKNISDFECISLVAIALSLMNYALGYILIPIFAERYTVALNLVLIIFLPLFMEHFKEKKIFLVLLLIYLYIINRQYQTLNFTISYLLGDAPSY